MAFIDHMFGLLHRQGVIQSDRLFARASTSPCRASGKTGQAYHIDQQTANASGRQGQEAKSKDAGTMYRIVYPGHDYEMVTETHC